MKTLILCIAVLFYVQPAAAGGCDMGGENLPGDTADQRMEHPMEEGHDCCEEAPANPQESCDHGIECSTCTAGVLAVTVSQVLALPFPALRSWEAAVRTELPSHTFPLYKPPIS